MHAVHEASLLLLSMLQRMPETAHSPERYWKRGVFRPTTHDCVRGLGASTASIDIWTEVVAWRPPACHPLAVTLLPICMQVLWSEDTQPQLQGPHGRSEES